MFLRTITLLSLSLLSVTLAAPNGHDSDNNYTTPQKCTTDFVTKIAVETVPVTITTSTLKTVVTTVVVTITTSSIEKITTVSTIPHSCYTYIEPTPQYNNAYCPYFNSATCNEYYNPCTKVQTVTVPCYDPCCPTTTTIKTPGACASCQVGCTTTTTVITPATCTPTTTKKSYY